MRASFSLPKRDLEDLPLTIEITLTVKEWQQLKLSDVWPGSQVGSMIGEAVGTFMDLSGSRWSIDRPYGSAEQETAE